MIEYHIYPGLAVLCPDGVVRHVAYVHRGIAWFIERGRPLGWPVARVAPLGDWSGALAA